MSMRNNSYRTSALLFGVMFAVCTGAVLADQREGPDPMRKAQFMLRQMATEKAALEAEKAKVEQELKDLQKKYDRLDKKLEHTEKSLEHSQENGKKLVDRIGRDNDRIREYVDRLREQIQKYRDTVHDLRVAQIDNRLLVKAVKEREDWITACRDKNRKLYEAGDDILNAYKNQTFWSSLTRDSSPVGMSRVSKENQEQEFQFRLEDLQSGEFKPKTDVVVAEHTQPEPVPEATPQEVPDPTGGDATAKPAESNAVAEQAVAVAKAEGSEAVSAEVGQAKTNSDEAPPSVVEQAKPGVTGAASSGGDQSTTEAPETVPVDVEPSKQEVSEAATSGAEQPKLETPETVSSDSEPSTSGADLLIGILSAGSLINQRLVDEAKPDVFAKVAALGCDKAESVSPYVVQMPHGDVGARTWTEKWIVGGCGSNYPVVIDFVEDGETAVKWAIE